MEKNMKKRVCVCVCVCVCNQITSTVQQKYNIVNQPYINKIKCIKTI